LIKLVALVAEEREGKESVMTEERIREIREKILACEEEIGKGIVGQRDIIRQVLLAMLAGGNVLLEGVPGLGKTQLVKTIAKVLGLSFGRIQFTPDLMPADVTGTNLILQEKGQNIFQFEKGPIFANLVLADEINRATPKTQAALLEAMQEGTVTAGKKTWRLPEPFFVLATQNPIENEGTYPLPEAQLDRFLLKLLVEFPREQELKKIMELTVEGKMLELSCQMEGEELLEARQIIRALPMSDMVADYALHLVVSTHPELPDAPEHVKKYVTCGASPRAAQAIFLTARGRAFLEGRMNVSFEDINEMAYPALRHRLLLNYEAVSDGIRAEDVIRQLLTEQ